MKWAAPSLNLYPQLLQNLSKVTQYLGSVLAPYPYPTLLLPALSPGVLFFHVLQCGTSQLHSPHGSCLPLFLLPPLTPRHDRLWLFLCPIWLSTPYIGGIHSFALGKGTAFHIGLLMPPIIAMLSKLEPESCGECNGCCHPSLQLGASSLPTHLILMVSYTVSSDLMMEEGHWLIIIKKLLGPHRLEHRWME